MKKTSAFFLILTLIFFSFETASGAKKSTKKTVSKKAGKKAPKPAQLNFKDLIKKAEETKTGSLIITQEGKFLVEKNWESPLSFYYMQGVTASLVTLALGSVLDEGKLNLDASMVQWIPEWLDDRGKIKVRQLLDHSSGFADNEKDPWFKSPDSWIWAQGQQIQFSPATTSNISDTNHILLGLVISKVTNESPEELVKKKIFSSLKIQKWGWDDDKAGHTNVAGGLRLRNYDLLKVGNLLAQNGSWNNQRIISQNWIEQIQKPSEKNPQYGLNWWLHDEKGLKAVYAFGYQGQYVVVVPEKKLVAIRLRSLVPVEQNKTEYDWTDFPKELMQILRK